MDIAVFTMFSQVVLAGTLLGNAIGVLLYALGMRGS